MRLLIATDAWRPQVNGVVQTYERLAEELRLLGHEPEFLTPNGFRTVPLPTYPEIRLAMITPGQARSRIAAFRPDRVHIATEGTIGLAVRSCCLRQGRPFTTSYHTRFPEYLHARLPVPESWGYALERWFHNAGNGIMVATQSLRRELAGKGLQRLMPWTRGVDTKLFRPRDIRLFGEGPVFLYVGRVAVEKNIGAFLGLDLPGRKVVVGGGPQLAALKAEFPQAHFTGPLRGEALAEAFASADVFVFPSRTDTYGVVILEALASGLPVAAFPVTGPKDIVQHGAVGYLSEDLRDAAMRALAMDRAACRDYALGFSWENCARQFVQNIASISNTPPDQP
ncbi:MULTISPECIES: glycosyltransferase family 1 protein [Rhodomicrobium]|uniref:glycosyltransferase family 4 protein n=1 Tax=Rhodomicrobium TaxID=1068 RepID=UPI000B4B924D|nr:MULTISPECIES: glycosyltransferase family 1 protein [Rhodomicrobium]